MEHGLYEAFFRAEDRHWWFRARRRILESVLERLPLPGGARIADLGCGTGGMFPVLRRFGEVTGVDDAPEAREYCARRGFTGVLTPEQWEADGARYHLVTALDVAEHVDDDVAFLTAAYRRIEPGGWAVVTVPAYSWLWSQFDEMNHHRRRYTRGALEASLRRSGFEIPRATYMNTFLFPPLALVRLGDRFLRGRRTEDPRELLDRSFKVGPLNRVLEAVFAAERHWLKHGTFPFGSSVLAVARKSGS